MQPDLNSLGILVALSLQLLLELSGLGALTVAAAAEVLAGTRKQVFLRKLAQQLSALAIWLLAYTLLSGGAMLGLLCSAAPQALETWTRAPLLAAPLAGAFGLALLLGVIYRFTWKALKDRKALHRILGLGAAGSGLAGLGLALAAKLTLAWNPGLTPATFAALYIESPAPVFWPLLAHTALWSLAGASGLGLVYLLLRRNRDDFGRDYYTFAVRHCCRWAALPALLQLGAAAALLAPAWAGIPRPMLGTATGLAAGGAAAAVLAAILLFNVSRAEAPLRHKPAILGAVTLLAAALTGGAGVIMLVVYG